jgi:hypothetical protein
MESGCCDMLAGIVVPLRRNQLGQDEYCFLNRDTTTL